MGDFSVLATRIKELRTKFDMSQRKFAEFVGCTAATLSAYENGSKSPSLEIVRGIGEKCNVSLDWLCGMPNDKSAIKTYADVLTLLLKISLRGGIFELDMHFYEDNPYPTISFHDDKMSDGIRDLGKIYNLYDTSAIDKDMYFVLAENVFKKYNIPINVAPF